MEQTAVEWLVEQFAAIRKQNSGYRNIKTEFKELIEQAKAMEKEQHKKTWSEGMFCETGDIQAFEQYYNKNFKNAN